MALILASKSPRRKELLSFITEDFAIKVSDADETLRPGMSPEEAVEYLSEIKGTAVARENNRDTVISSDTIVVLDNMILGKPHSREEAYSMLTALSGRTHEVYTGVCIIAPDKKISFACRTEVTFYPLTDEEIEKYIETGEPFDKAGAYGIQGKGALLIEGIKGDYYNVMGLPVARLQRALKENNLL